MHSDMLSGFEILAYILVAGFGVIAIVLLIGMVYVVKIRDEIRSIKNQILKDAGLK
jgi:hypothetical protein